MAEEFESDLHAFLAGIFMGILVRASQLADLDMKVEPVIVDGNYTPRYKIETRDHTFEVEVRAP